MSWPSSYAGSEAPMLSRESVWDRLRLVGAGIFVIACVLIAVAFFSALQTLPVWLINILIATVFVICLVVALVFFNEPQVRGAAPTQTMRPDLVAPPFHADDFGTNAIPS